MANGPWQGSRTEQTKQIQTETNRPSSARQKQTDQKADSSAYFLIMSAFPAYCNMPHSHTKQIFFPIFCLRLRLLSSDVSVTALPGRSFLIFSICVCVSCFLQHVSRPCQADLFSYFLFVSAFSLLWCFCHCIARQIFSHIYYLYLRFLFSAVCLPAMPGGSFLLFSICVCVYSSPAFLTVLCQADKCSS